MWTAILLTVFSILMQTFTHVDGCFSNFLNKEQPIEYIYSIPSSGPFLGGYSIRIKGTEFKASDMVVLTYNDKTNVDCKYQDKSTVVCPVPLLDQLGQIPLMLHKNGLQYFGYFQGVYVYVNQQTFMQRPDYYFNPITTNITIKWSVTDASILAQGLVINAVSYTTDLYGRVNVYERVLSEDATSLSSLTFSIRSILAEDSYRFNSADTNLGGLMVHLKSKKDDTLIDWIKEGVFTLNSAKTAQETCLTATDSELPLAVNELSTEIPCPSVLQVPSGGTPWRDFFEAFRSDEACNRFNLTRPCRIYPGAAWCYRSVYSTTNGYGEQCCYNWSGSLIVGHPGGAALDKAHQSTVDGVFDHFRKDSFYYIACCILSNNCPQYYVLRPTITGQKWNPSNSAGLFGLLHFITYDNLNYTIRKTGKYDLLKISSTNLQVQVDIQPLSAKNGMGLRSVLLREGLSGLLKIELNKNGRIVVTYNDIPLSFNDSSSFYFNSFLIAKQNSMYSVSLRSGILIEVITSSDIMNLKASMPVKFKGKVTGLLGNWDDNSANDAVSDSFTITNNNIGTGAHSDCMNNLECIYDQNITGDIGLAKLGLQVASEIMFEKSWFTRNYKQM